MCGCRQPRTSDVSTGTASTDPGIRAAATGRVSLRYRGARALLVRGPATGVGYACYPGDTIVVSARDVDALVASGAFLRS
jgi:hypothetical protein